MTIIAKALNIAINVHRDQVDKNGEPYILHPIRVMADCGELGEDYACAALLHDVLEDSDLESDVLSSAYEFSQAVVEAVDALTRRDGEPYFDYVRRCKNNNIARAVKLSDLKDNMRPSRDANYLSRKRRYERAVEILLDR